MKDIPGPDDLDADWFTERLRAAGYPQSVVRSVSKTQIGTGQIGTCYRYVLDFKSVDESAPRTLIGKFPSDDPMSRATGLQLRNYYREVEFYQKVAADLSISIPRCYYADIEGEGPEFLLLLEDMAPAVQGDQLTGCSAEVARAAVLELVGLQAPSWCREDLKQYDWLFGRTDDPVIDPGALYAQLLPGFIDRYGHALADDEREIISRVAASPSCPLFEPVDMPFCLEHVDFRLDNMLIDATQPSPEITVVDWQSVRIGKPLNDVAYFLGAGLLPDVRREVEEDIVRAYHTRLLEAGIENFGWNRCWEDYRRGSFSGFGVTVIASMIVQQTERGDEMFIAMATRHARHALDVGADEFLD
jgi:aminoglycoside/choline kinase family phosphotransferase